MSREPPAQEIKTIRIPARHAPAEVRKLMESLRKVSHRDTTVTKFRNIRGISIKANGHHLDSTKLRALIDGIEKHGIVSDNHSKKYNLPPFSKLIQVGIHKTGIEVHVKEDEVTDEAEFTGELRQKLETIVIQNKHLPQAVRDAFNKLPNLPFKEESKSTTEPIIIDTNKFRFIHRTDSPKHVNLVIAAARALEQHGFVDKKHKEKYNLPKYSKLARTHSVLSVQSNHLELEPTEQ